MNVKVNQLISELPEVEKMFVMPSCGDEANAIGCCYYGYKGKKKPIKDLYLGSEYDEKYVENFIKEKKLEEKYTITKE